MKTIYFIVFAYIFLTSCTVSSELKDFSKNNLIFGSGGGFVGTSNEYIVHYDGVIEEMNSFSKEKIQIITISKKETKTLFQQFLDSGLDTLEYSVPGNMYYFIGYKNDSVTQKITWGGEKEPPSEAKELYNILNQLISNQ